MKSLTIVCPAYNEARGIAAFHSALAAVLGTLSSYHSDIVFVVDGGEDDTFDILTSIADTHPNVSILKFTRNFGHQMALLAGTDHAEGDVIIMMDSDLQHPPELIPRLLAEYEKGSDIVYTVRTRERVGMARRAAGSLFYRFVNMLSGVPIQENASDFRLISRQVADVLKKDIRERDMFLRGMVQWIGFPSSSVRFTPNPRFAGVSGYSLGKLLALAISGAISFSKKPLRAAIVAGVLLALFGLGFILFTLFEYFSYGEFPPGWATVVILLAIFGSVQLVFLGVLGEYIGVIFDEVKARPRYIVEKTIVSRSQSRKKHPNNTKQE